MAGRNDGDEVLRCYGDFSVLFWRVAVRKGAGMLYGLAGLGAGTELTPTTSPHLRFRRKLTRCHRSSGVSLARKAGMRPKPKVMALKITESLSLGII